MKTKLPGYHIGAGIVFLSIALLAKHVLPQQQWDFATSFQLPCTFISSVLLPSGTFLAFQSLLIQSDRRRALFAEFLSGFALLPLLLSFCFFTYVMVNRAVTKLNSFPSILPAMVEAARTSPKLEMREKIAENAYQMYGAILAIPLDNTQIVYFVPSEEDKTERQKLEASDGQMKKSILVVEHFSRQLTYLFSLYVSTYSVAFLVGGTLLFFRLPKSINAPKS